MNKKNYCSPEPFPTEVYILHFDKPYWGNCRHYVGYSKLGAEERLRRHMSGRGSMLVAYAVRHGNIPKLAYVERCESPYHARYRELQLKAGKNLSRLCLICQRNKVRKGNK